jgi:hypothetical protein
MHGNVLSGQVLENALELSLHRTARWLPLPPREILAEVVKHRVPGDIAGHAPEDIEQPQLAASVTMGCVI